MKRKLTFYFDEEDWNPLTDDEKSCYVEPTLFYRIWSDFGEHLRQLDKYSDKEMVDIGELREKFWDIYRENVE